MSKTILSDLKQKVAKFNHKLFLKSGGGKMISNLIGEQTYMDALNLARENEFENEIGGLMSSLEGLDKACETIEPVVEACNKQANVQVGESAEETEKMTWLEGALDLQNKTVLEKEEYKRFEDISKKVTNELNGIYVETQTLEKAREDALRSFDIASVVSIDEKLKNLQTLYSEKIKEVSQHKNQLANYEQEYEQKYKELEDSLKNTNFNRDKVSINKEHFGNKVLNDFKENKGVELVRGFLSNYPKDVAKNILKTTPALIEKLGDKFNELVKEYE